MAAFDFVGWHGIVLLAAEEVFDWALLPLFGVVASKILGCSLAMHAIHTVVVPAGCVVTKVDAQQLAK